MKAKQKAKNAIEWIDGLAETNAKQGVGSLGDEEMGFCCLGYGCKVLDLEYDRMESASYAFQRSVGLRDADGTTLDSDSSMTLISLNDEGGYSFKAISKVLKDDPWQYFDDEVAELIKKHYAL